MTDNRTRAHDERAQSGLQAFAAGQTDRLELIKQIESVRGSVVISYLTSIRPGFSSYVDDRDVRVIEAHIKKAKADGAQAIDLFLTTTGGMATFPWDFLAMFREHLPKAKLGVLIPYWAYSAGTATALGADEIVMGPSGVLGPVDSQMLRRRMELIVNSRLIHSFSELIEQLGTKKSPKGINIANLLAENSDPLILGALHRAAKEDDRYLDNAFGSRLKSLSKKDADRIREFFLDGVNFHSQGIRRTEARANGVSYLTNSEDTGAHDAMERLFEHYAAVMKLFHPVSGYEELEFSGGFFDAYGQHSTQTPIAVVESRYDSNPAFSAYQQDRHWEVPPPLEGESPAQPPENPQFRPERIRLNWATNSQLRAISEGED